MMVTASMDRGSSRTMEKAMGQVGEHGVFKDLEDVDVKDLLETGRVIIEKKALDTLLFAHASDLGIVANLGYALHAEKEDFLQFAQPMSNAQLAQANEAMLEEMLENLEEDEDYLQDGLEVEDVQAEERRVGAQQ
jgi:hypothetical protein